MEKKKDKQEVIKEIQRILIKEDYSVKCVFEIGRWMQENLETADEYIGKPEFKDFLDKLNTDGGLFFSPQP